MPINLTVPSSAAATERRSERGSSRLERDVGRPDTSSSFCLRSTTISRFSGTLPLDLHAPILEWPSILMLPTGSLCPDRVPDSVWFSRAQNSGIAFASVPWTGQPCQKHPSTKTATFADRKTISAFLFKFSAGLSSSPKTEDPCDEAPNEVPSLGTVSRGLAAFILAQAASDDGVGLEIFHYLLLLAFLA